MHSKKNIVGFLGVVLALAAIAFGQMRSTSADGPGLGDAQIAHIAVTADNIDIAYAHLALALSDNPAVRRFAETMISESRHGKREGRCSCGENWA